MPDTKFFFQNFILNSLQSKNYDHLIADLDKIQLSSGQKIYGADEFPAYIYFPESCLISKVLTTSEGDEIETGIVGRFGMTGLSAIMGIDHETGNTMVQIPGTAFRLKTELVKKEFNQCGFLHNLMLRYSYLFITQLSYSVL